MTATTWRGGTVAVSDGNDMTTTGEVRIDPPDVGSRSEPLSPKIIAEMRELHDRSVGLSRLSRVHRFRTRRERRAAREAEGDFLRALGFDAYEQFVAVARAIDRPLRPAPELALVDSGDAVDLIDAHETEAALLRILQDAEGAKAVRPTNEPHARTNGAVASLGGNDDDLPGAQAAAVAGLVEAVGELRSLCELLRAERVELAALGASVRAEAEALLEQARADAQRLQDEASVAARTVLDRAQADAVTLTRNALSTVDGLHRLAAERSSGDTHRD